MTETYFHIVLLTVASSALLVPLLWNERFSWVDPLFLFGGTLLVFALGKYLYLTFIRPIADQPAWAVAANLHQGVWATLIFSLPAMASYVLVRAQLPMQTAQNADRMAIDMRTIYLVSIAFVIVSCLAFIEILSSTALSISLDSVSAKRFFDEVVGPAGRVGTYEYFLFRLTLAARIPLYCLVVGAILRRKFYALDFALIAACFLAILLTAFIFSNRFNLLLVFVDVCAILAIIGRQSIQVRHLLAGIAVFVAIVITTEFRVSDDRDMSTLDHIFFARSFTDVGRTDAIVDYYSIHEKHLGETFYNWLFIVFPREYFDGGQAFLNMGWNTGYHVFGTRASGVP
ncbi:MAG: hypothetical protein HKN84_05945, partial [Gammaproteobacteria bacterium]|nr:hypothetical protein [Gammaproteobacteria bacterium]